MESAKARLTTRKFGIEKKIQELHVRMAEREKRDLAREQAMVAVKGR